MAQIYIKIKNNPTRKIKNFPQIPSFPFLFSICNPHFAEKVQLNYKSTGLFFHIIKIDIEDS